MKKPNAVDLIKSSLEESKRRGGLRSAIEDEIRVWGYYWLPKSRSDSEVPKEIQLGWPFDPRPSPCIVKQ